MRIGAVYPQNAMRGDPEAVRIIGLGAEELGFDSILFYDHVVGAEHADRDPALWGPYTEADAFHDPLVVFGYLAGITRCIELATGILILPQRQTVLVAQQAADADLLSGGRVRLGVGTGWNWVEYEALGEDFASRGARLDEQIDLLRRLWTEPLVTYRGAFHTLERCCINPRPARGIPIYVGGFSEPAFRRGGTTGDGFTFAGDVGEAIIGMERVRHHLHASRRDLPDFPMELIMTRARSASEAGETAARWQDAGGTAVSVLTEKRGLDTPHAHVEYLEEVKSAVEGRVR